MLLHVTNGDSAGGTLERLFPPDTVLRWRDPLHEGPLPPDLELAELGEVRARFLSCYGPLDEIRAQFHARDATLARFAEFDETILWFEHDLYDQLQLVQILDWFRGRECRLALVQASTYLGAMTPECMLALFPSRMAVTAAQFRLASDAWAAVRSPDPNDLLPYLEPHAEMPWLAPALLRFCEEYPWSSDRLTRTQRFIAGLRRRGLTDPQALFREFSKTEDPIWMGDSSFFRILDGAQDRDMEWLWDATRRQFVRRRA